MTTDPGVAVRRLAVDALARIEDGAYANLITPSLLARSGLDDRDRHFVTELVYGTTRLRRACDHLVDRHRRGKVAPRVRAALRVGAYQLAFGQVAPHAAVNATVGAAPRPARGLVNAVLRRVADDVAAGIEWPDLPTELSYPDWIVAALVDRLGVDAATAALRAMNEAAVTHQRDDGYVQDLASQEVVRLVEAAPGMRAADVCAAPGGKSTGLARSGASVVAADTSATRAGLLRRNIRDAGHPIPVLVADATRPPFRHGTFDRVLVDAPCSGLGVLRRRPDARWRIEADAPSRLAALQQTMLESGLALLAPGGMLVYSVCTLTRDENRGVVDRIGLPPDVSLVDDITLEPGPESDGMYVARWRRADRPIRGRSDEAS